MDPDFEFDLDDAGVRRTAFDQDCFAVEPGQVLTGRALPVTLHTCPKTDEVEDYLGEQREEHRDGGPPTEGTDGTVEAAEDGTVLRFDTGGGMQPAHFGERSWTLAKAHGARGTLCAGKGVRGVVRCEVLALVDGSACTSSEGPGW